MDLFQSLIGRLKTESRTTIAAAHSKFQSLIGRLKTSVAYITIGFAIRFQSLIGRLKTDIPFALGVQVDAVSIPHR